MNDQKLWCLCGWTGLISELSKVYNRVVSDAISEYGQWEKMYNFSCPKCRQFFFITGIEDKDFTEKDKI